MYIEIHSWVAKKLIYKYPNLRFYTFETLRGILRKATVLELAEQLNFVHSLVVSHLLIIILGLDELEQTVDANPKVDGQCQPKER